MIKVLLADQQISIEFFPVKKILENEKGETNLAILNFPSTIDILEERRELSAAECLDDRQRFRLLSERSTVTEIQIIGFVIDRVVSHALAVSLYRLFPNRWYIRNLFVIFYRHCLVLLLEAWAPD